MTASEVLNWMAHGHHLYVARGGRSWHLTRRFGQVDSDVVDDVLASGQVCRRFSGLRGYYVYGDQTIDSDATKRLSGKERRSGKRIYLPAPERDLKWP